MSADETTPAPTRDPEDKNNLAPLRAGLRYGLLGLIALTVISLAIWLPIDGLKGLWGVLIGAAVGGGFILITLVVIMSTVNMTPSSTMAMVMGSWVLKMVIVLVVVGVLKRMDFYSLGALVTMLIGSIVAVLGAEVWGVLKTQVPYTDV